MPKKITERPAVPPLGCTAAYVFAYRNQSMTIDDYMDALESVSRMGFVDLDLEILNDDHISIYTARRIRQLREQAKKWGVRLCGFTPWNVQKYLYTLDAGRRRKGLRMFDEECRIIRELGITEVHLGADAPVEIVADRKAEYTGAPPSGLRFDKVSWPEVWNLTVATYREANRIAKKHGLRFGLEPRANCVIWSADSFLRLREALGSNLGCVWDLMHAAYHREDSALAVRKLGSSLLSLQLCDADGEKLHHHPLGEGIVDLGAVKQAVRDTRFRGPLLLELYRSGKEKRAEVDRYYAASKKHWEAL